MKTTVFVVLATLLAAGACAKKAQPAAIERADMLEGQLLNVGDARIQELERAQNAKWAEYKGRLIKQYGLDFDAGDSVNLETGAIARHKSLPPEVAKKVAEGKKTGAK